MLAAVVTQFPFVEKVITPYILVLVTTPMLALVPLLILRSGRIRAADHRRGAGQRADGDDQRGHGVPADGQRQDRARPVLWGERAADLLEDPGADGLADDPLWV